VRVTIEKKSSVRFHLIVAVIIAVVLAGRTNVSQVVTHVVDPGPRPGPAGAGGHLPGVTATELQLFEEGQETIQEVDSVSGAIPNTGSGLGPRFNMDGCSGCHSHPAPGGSSPPVNPMIAVATRDGATNLVPFFITLNGPIRRAFIRNVGISTEEARQTHLFTIAGRSDAAGCNLAQPDFEALRPRLSFHIPLPLFGDGLIENIDTATLAANLETNLIQKRALGISGRLAGFGGSGRFFWKGQGNLLDIIASGAYRDDVGVTNFLIPTESDGTPSCRFNSLPEDRFDFSAPDPISGLPDFAKIAGFIRFSAPPAPSQDTPSIANGRSLFNTVGCALCHTPSLQTGSSSSAALNRKTVFLYSDLALHRMGPGLADGLAQGNATASEFRTPPLWGVGQRPFLLHDGRTKDLVVAINAHFGGGDGSEANGVIRLFNNLSDQQKQDIVTFLRSL
jgi:CxxC motif-containing protein (DUF1111 family)